MKKAIEKLRNEEKFTKGIAAIQIEFHYNTQHNFYNQGRKCWEGPAIKEQRLLDISRVENEIRVMSDRSQELEKIVCKSGTV